MKPITFSQFVSLVKSADLIEFDTNDIDSHEVGKDSVTLHWKAEPEGFDDCGECDYQAVIEDDNEFFFDSTKGQVKYKDSDEIEVEVNFYMKVPLKEIPVEESAYSHKIINGFSQGHTNVPSNTKGHVTKTFADGDAMFETIYGTFCVNQSNLEKL